MASITLTPDVTNEAIQAFMEQNANAKLNKKKTANQTHLARQNRKAYLDLYYPKFENADFLIGNKLNLEKRIGNLQKNFSNQENDLRVSLKEFLESKSLPVFATEFSSMLNSPELTDKYFSEWYNSIGRAGRDNVDAYYETLEELYYWSSQPEINDSNRWEYAQNPGVLYNKIRKHEGLNGISNIKSADTANQLMNNIDWEYVESNSLIKQYEVNAIYHFKNGSFKFLGGDPTDITKWERQ
tara:strand:+ start:3714 stop:4436 length:723 start_codon:yes stop_codon:yes gene_type:complete